MELKFKRLEDEAVLPIRSTEGAAGIDLTCIKIDNMSGVRLMRTL